MAKRPDKGRKLVVFSPKSGAGDATSPEPSPSANARANARRRRLDTLPRLRREIVELYHEARAGRLNPQAATRLGWLLVAAAKLIEGGELEARVAELERRLAGDDR
jgi:hypothetical protein